MPLLRQSPRKISTIRPVRSAPIAASRNTACNDADTLRD